MVGWLLDGGGIVVVVEEISHHQPAAGNGKYDGNAIQCRMMPEPPHLLA
mgnify:CR=1 FL=1